MTHKADCTLSEEIMEQIAEQGLDILPEVVRIIVNTAMQAERQAYLGVHPYERSPQRRDYANGYKPKTMATRIGEITFDVPQVRKGDFYPSALERGIRSERALKLALAEMYVQGVSTRKVAAITEKLCGIEVSSTQVSQAAALLDEQLQEWRERPLGRCPYLYLDAHYEKVRQSGQVRDAAVLKAIGVNDEGKREVLGVSVSLSEHEVHWRNFLGDLVARGLTGVQLIISDAHAGLAAARKAVFGGVPWQRCQFHLQQNALAYVPRMHMRAEVAADIRSVFNAPNLAEAERLLKQLIDKYKDKDKDKDRDRDRDRDRAPQLAAWAEENIPEGLTVFQFPPSHWRRIRTSNGVERLNREIRRRSRVATLFPNEASCLRLVTAVVMEISEEWQTNRIYLSLD
jgi:putative transposase